MDTEFIFQDQIDGYSRIEYLSVFISFLYAFVIAEFFVGWARMVRSRSAMILCLDHLTYSIIFFWILILNWYALWSRMPYLKGGFVYFLVIILPLVIAYLAAVVLFPDLEKEKNLKDYFTSQRKTIFFAIATFTFVNWVIAMALGEILGLSVNSFVRVFISILFALVAFLDKPQLVRPAAVIVALGLLAGTIKMALI